MNDYFSELNGILTKTWKTYLGNNPFFKLVLDGEIDRKLYALYLIETFHYTSHNTKNQAIVPRNIQISTPKNIQYMKYCLHHAFEECGHELMAYHDLKSIGVNLALEELPKPLAKTEELIQYLYKVSENGNPLQRLGYSYWAESSYKYFAPVISAIKDKLNLKNSNLTFLVAHGEIDDHHFKEIMDIMNSQITTEDDKESIKDVMIKSLEMTNSMLEDIYNLYQDVKSGENTNYKFLELMHA